MILETLFTRLSNKDSWWQKGSHWPCWRSP